MVRCEYVNLDETKFMIFDNSDQIDAKSVGNITIKECKIKKYIGLIVAVDNKLSFTEHIAHIKKKVN